jgi:hypothetical protein
VAELVGRGDARPAALAQMSRRCSASTSWAAVVDDIARGQVLVVGLQPGIDPESGQAHQLFLAIGHAARDIHHVEDDRVAVGPRVRLPGAVALVVADGDDAGLGGSYVPEAIWRLRAAR